MPSLNIVFFLTTCCPKLIETIEASLCDMDALLHQASLSLDEIISGGKCISHQVRCITMALVSRGQFP